MKVLVTGSSGLIGSEAVMHFDREGHEVIGIDNNMRMDFFGEPGDTRWNLKRLKNITRSFSHLDIDIRDRTALFDLFKRERFDFIVHCAAQPSHDKAKEIPLIDFDVNACGTINCLEATRNSNPDAIFIHMSTNKVYGDSPNEVPLVELPTRWDYAREEDHKGIREDCRIDRCLHSVFGANKAASDIIAQEYGRYFNMNVAVFRGGCLTGEHHSGVQLHGFLSFLFKVAKSGEVYSIFGHKGKQVRDQIHSSDVISAMVEFGRNPKHGEVYNVGGGRENSVSILECISKIEALLGKHINTVYYDDSRIGDHICYISDMSKFKSHYPNWRLTVSIDNILERMARASL